ncbi:unnamed protein product [Oppiella nova]|uniref:Uncharacterized protein n=1 Tax=Oppiella nova TaxID=334625 RepID=A0A7R9MFK4_9ACAR|nr:unnamed protein product [Oppiella nova]CAG2176085.1 unnamed protein product [Oppiella nova]
MISVLLCMGVTIPESMGLGGGALILIYNVKTNKSVAINAREKAPAAAYPNLYKDRGHANSVDGPLAIGVPGELHGYWHMEKAPAAAYPNLYKDRGHANSVDGPLAIGVPGELHGYWHMFTEYGSKNVAWSELFEGAIGLCNNGFPVSEHLGSCLTQKESYILKHTALKDVYVNPETQKIYKQGETMKQLTLGQTLKRISESADPVKLYYEEISKTLVEDIENSAKDWDVLNNTQPIITVKDFLDYRPVISDAVHVRFDVNNKLENNLMLHSNAREKAPAAAYPNLYKDRGHANSVDGPLAIGVPGELHGYWHMYTEYGSKNVTWSELFEGAIGLCNNGFPVSEHLGSCLTQKESYILKHTALKNVYVNNETQKIYKQGETMKQTLKRISESPDPVKLYYEEISKTLVEDIENSAKDWDILNNTQPIITVKDFLDYRPVISDAVHVRFDVHNKLENNLMLHSFPLPGSGNVLSFIMNVMQRYPDLYPNSADILKDSVLFYHRLIETYKYAFTKRSHLEDSETSKVLEVLEQLRSNEFAQNVSAYIDDSQTFKSDSGHYDKTPVFMSEDHGTAHASVVDSLGNVVAVTTTVNT